MSRHPAAHPSAEGARAFLGVSSLGPREPLSVFRATGRRNSEANAAALPFLSDDVSGYQGEQESPVWGKARLQPTVPTARPEAR